ncbi:adhesion G-protein coupled receptor G1-like isoform X1 [Carassius gibelio]|uniref:adhesion G-protein coupled receptor G1-like isoform X1 n=1 Tax=Carassius gibelio TaxID=101364 RepID=UPI0022790E91|nr:adhesion G-protein coupled receptor G1-like isoform X1 [Carassius gibelio]
MSLSLGIMIWKMLNLLWLIIICCVTSQMTCSKMMIIRETDINSSSFSSSNTSFTAINMTCSPGYEILIGNFCIVDVQQNTSVLGECNSYRFNITNDGGNYKVRMNDMVKNIIMWFLPNGSRCLPSEVLNSSGSTSNNYGTCQTQQSSSTTTQSISTITNNPSSCPNRSPINTSCNAIYPDACCLKTPPVNPEITCRNASYGNDTCTGNEKSRYIMYLNGSEWMCVTCDGERSTTPQPTTSSTSYTTTNTPTTSSTSDTTTNTPTTSSTLHTINTPTTSSTSDTTTNTPTTSSTLHTINTPTTSSTSYTTTNTPTTSSTSYTTTNTPTTSSTLHTINTPTTSSTSDTTTNTPTTSSTLHTINTPTTSSTSYTTSNTPTTSSTSHTSTKTPTTSTPSHASFMTGWTTPEPTVPPPEIIFTLSNKTNQTNTVQVQDPQEAVENLEKVESLVEVMEKNNKTNAAIVMGDVIGVLQRQPRDKPTKDINICYSSNQNMINVVESNQAGYPWSVKIPREAFNKSRQENNGSAFVGVLRFKNMENKDKTHTVLGNESYGITMGANISNLTDNIDMTIQKNNKLDGNVSCVSWDGKGELNWTTFGCETIIENNTIKCSCSHLTFFAVLMTSQSDTKLTSSDLESLTLISSIGCGISIFFLSIGLFMHFLLRKAKSNQATKILMNMFVALFLLNASFLSNESVANTKDNAACVFIALLLHYSMLASFTWFFIQALHMYLWLIRQNVSITNYMRKITVLGWVCAAPIVVGIASGGEYKVVTLNSTSGKIAHMCWTTNPYIHYIVNIGYYALVFVFTAGIFIMIVTKVFQARKIKTVDGKRKTFRKQLMMVLSLFLLFGLTWSVAFFSYGPMLIPSYYIFTVLNSLQGFFLFLYYYHIHNDVAGQFSDDPENTDSNTTITQSGITAVENIYH